VILVDSSVWIDFFRNVDTAQAEWLDLHLGDETVLVGDLILAEVLRGFKEDRGFTEAKRLLGRLEQISLCGEDLAVEAARNYRRLRARSVTVRGTIDVIIATRCLVDDYRLLHSDRDFDPFEEHLGLRVVNCGALFVRPRPGCEGG
jgi:predicted nucleic acid-binding protein